MIGGVDISIPSWAGELTTEVAVRAIRQCWPSAVFENGLTGESYPTFEQIPFGGLEGLLVYRDPNAAQLWDDEGGVPATRNSMIHLIAEPDGMVMVIDREDIEMNVVLTAIRSALFDRNFMVPYRLEAA